MQEGATFEQSLRTREFEPDAPNYTPRISAILSVEDGGFDYSMSILKSNNGNGDACNRYTFDYENPVAGEAHFTILICTMQILCQALKANQS